MGFLGSWVGVLCNFGLLYSDPTKKGVDRTILVAKNV